MFFPWTRYPTWNSKQIPESSPISSYLVGGFSPSQKYACQFGSFPQIGMKRKYELTPCFFSEVWNVADHLPKVFGWLLATQPAQKSSNWDLPGINLVRPHDFYLLCWEPLISTTNLRFLWRLQNWYMNTYQVSISSIQVGILKEFMYQKSWQPSFLTGSNSFWFALATASVQNGAMEPWTSEERLEMSDPSVWTVEISPKLMEGSNWICCLLYGGKRLLNKIVACTIW